MTTAMQAVRRTTPGESDRSALRVAIARGGRIEREWILESGSVTVGRSDDADVCIAHHASSSSTLVRIDDGEMTLVVPTGASGRLQLATGPRDLAQLAGTSITLDSSARGRIVLAGRGDDAVAVLFQRVAAPEKRARPQLPSAVRGGLLDRVDWLFTAVAAASFMLHFAVVVGLSEADWPMPPSLAMVDDRIADIVYSDATIPPMPTLTDPTDPSTPTDPTTPTSPTSPSDPSPRHPTTSHGDPAPQHSPDVDPTIALNDSVDTALQLLLGSTGIDGAIQNLVANGQPTTDSAAILAAAASVQPSTSTASLDPRDGHSSALPGSTFDPRAIGSRPGERPEGRELTEAGPRPPHVALQPIDGDPVDPTIFDDAMLRRALRARMPAIQQCYEAELTRTPGLAGRISISMQVERIGSLSHVVAADDTVGSRGLATCVINNVSTIRLATGPSEAVTVEYPIVFAPQN